MALTVLLAALAVRLFIGGVGRAPRFQDSPTQKEDRKCAYHNLQDGKAHHPPSGLRHRFLSGNVAYLSGLFTGFGRGFAFAGRAG